MAGVGCTYFLSCRCGQEMTWVCFAKGDGPGPCPCGKKIWTVRRPYP